MKSENKAFCNQCNTFTKHSILAEHKIPDVAEFEENGKIESVELGVFYYQVIECNGCETISFRARNFRTEYMEFDDKTQEQVFIPGKYYDTYFPERTDGMLLAKHIIALPESIEQVYHETIKCYNNNIPILCGAGLRTITEAICSHFKADGDSLGAKIASFSKHRMLPNELTQSLRDYKFIGNEALHNQICPTKEELKYAIELLETILDTLFNTPFRRKELAKRLADRFNE